MNSVLRSISWSLIVTVIFIGITLSSCKEEGDDTVLTNAASDTTSPMIVSSSPADSSTDIPINTNITITFNEVIDESV